jgi:GLPGLI family protein
MKKSFTYIFIFFIVAITAQNNKILATYEVVANLSNQPIYIKAELFIENNQSLYIVNPKNVKYDKDNSIVYSEKEDTYIKYSYSESDNIFYLFRDGNQNLIKHTSGNNTKFLIEEKIYSFNWKIKKETKKIGEFLCTKATTYFRGRNYIAWYSAEVPVNKGPWKFSGLPGLILEIYDEDNIFSWQLKNIKYPYKGNFELILPNEKSYQKLKLKEYVAIKEQNSLDYSKRITTKLPQGSVIRDMKIKRNGIELIYEWEEE